MFVANYNFKSNSDPHFFWGVKCFIKSQDLQINLKLAVFTTFNANNSAHIFTLGVLFLCRNSFTIRDEI